MRRAQVEEGEIMEKINELGGVVAGGKASFVFAHKALDFLEWCRNNGMDCPIIPWDMGMVSVQFVSERKEGEKYV